MFYYLNGYEIGAYTSQFSSILLKYEGKFKSVQDIVDFLKNTYIYKNYMVLIDDANFLINTKSKEQKEAIMEKLPMVYNINFKTYESFAAYLKSRIRKVLRKFNALIPKIAYDNASMVRTSGIIEDAGRIINYKPDSLSEAIRMENEYFRYFWLSEL